MVSWIMASVSRSTAEVASSNKRIKFERIKALARHICCRWPWLSSSKTINAMNFVTEYSPWPFLYELAGVILSQFWGNVISLTSKFLKCEVTFWRVSKKTKQPFEGNSILKLDRNNLGKFIRFQEGNLAKWHAKCLLPFGDHAYKLDLPPTQ